MGCPRSPQKTNQRPAARTMSSCSAIATGSGSLARPRRERRVRRCLGALTPASAASAAASSARPSPPEICGSMLHSTRLCSTRPGNPSETPPGGSSRRLPHTSLRENTSSRHRIPRGARHSSLQIFSTKPLCLRVFSRFVLSVSIGLQRCRIQPVVRRCVPSRDWKSLNS
jgi:hypothetical protein